MEDITAIKMEDIVKAVASLIKENEKLKAENSALKHIIKRYELAEENNVSSGWDFHYSGHGNYEAERRAFYGEFS